MFNQLWQIHILCLTYVGEINRKTHAMFKFFGEINSMSYGYGQSQFKGLY